MVKKTQKLTLKKHLESHRRKKNKSAGFGIQKDKTFMYFFIGILCIILVQAAVGDFIERWNLNAGNTVPFGIATNGTMILVADTTDNQIYQYTMSGSFINTWNLNVSNTDADGIATNSTWLWVLDEADDEVYVYYTNSTFISSWDTNAAGNTVPRGVETNGTEGADCCIWTTDTTGDKIYKWKMDGTAVTSTALTAANSEPRGIATNDGTFLWVTDNTDDEVYKYWGNNGTYTGISFDTNADACTVLTGITIENSFWVVDTNNDEVCRFERLAMSVTLNEPANATTFSSSQKNLSASYEGGIHVLKNATYYIWFADNSTVFNNSLTVTIPSATNVTNNSFSGIQPENYLWNIKACGETATATLCKFADSNFSFTFGAEIIDLNFSNPVTEGNTESFKVNITVPSGFQLSTANLIYDGSSFIGSIDSITGTNYSISRSLEIPAVTADINKTFFWSFTLENGFNHNSTSNIQQTNNVGIDDCSAFSTLILNFTLRDEETKEQLDVVTYDSNIEVDVNINPTNSLNPIITFSQNYSQVNSAHVCIDNDLLNSTYDMYVEVLYEANTYASEHYNIQKASLTNTTIPQNISLFDLNASDSQTFLITFKDEFFLPVENALIDIQRKYTEDGVFRSVEIPKTDSSGQTTGHFDLEGVLYTLLVTQNGSILAAFNNTAIVCQDQLIGDCRLNLNAFSTSIPFTAWESVGGLSYTMDFSEASRTITTIFTTSDGTAKAVLINTTLQDRWGNKSVCSDSLTSSSGTLTCTIPATFGNATFISKLFSDGELVTTRVFKISPNVEQYFGKANAGVMILILIITIPLMLTTSTIGVVLGIFAGVIMAVLLNLYTSGSLLGVASSITWVIIAGGIIIWKIAKRGG